MTRKTMIAVLGAFLAVPLFCGIVSAHGFGGGGGSRGGGFSGGGGFRGGYSGGGMSSFSRTPSFSSSRSFESARGYGGGTSYGNRGTAQGMNGGRIEYGSRSGSYTTARGGSIDYGAAGYGARGPGGGAAGRGVYGVEGTTAGGRSFADVGRAGGAVGPGGNAVGGRSNIGAVSGPRGTAVEGSRAGFAAGPRGVVAGGSRGGLAVGSGGAVAGRSFGASAFRPNGFNAYGGYHQGWVHGYWNGHDNAAWGWHNNYWGGGWGLGMGFGMGLGWGLSSWGFGSALYGMGYMPYANPYYGYGAATAMVVPYDYSQPINTVSPPADEAVTNPAMALFDAGRASFRQGIFAEALQQTNDALAKLPDDTTLHEFRALCLFALGRYDEAAATLYAVLSVGPGWDWTTLISLYPGVDIYTVQLRALEEYCTIHGESATGRFVLAYHYLTQGHTEAAVDILKQVVALKPGDTLSTKLLHQLDPPKDSTNTAAAPAPATAPPQGASIAGTWNAHPAADIAIALTVQPGGAFTWQVTQKGREQQFSGTSTYGEGIFTLAQDKGPALVGRVSWTDANHITFRIVGDGPEDPGLSFSR
jgi:tetratricopeptide repeat protein